MEYDYHRDYGRISNSMLGVFRQSPLLYYKRFIERSVAEEESEALRVGRMMHSWLLEKPAFWGRYCRELVADRRTKAGKLAAQMWESLRQGREPVTAADEAMLIGMEQGIARHADLSALLAADGVVEKPIFFELDGVPCKARPDKVFPEARLVLDLKSSVSADPAEFRWSVKKFGYANQQAWYEDALKQQYGGEWTFLFAVVQKVEPFEVSLVELPRRQADAGREENMRALADLKRRAETGDWTRFQGVTVLDG